MMGLFVFTLSVEISSQVLELEILFGSNWDAFFFFNLSSSCINSFEV